MKKISLIVMSCMIACGLLANHGIVKDGEMSPKVGISPLQRKVLTH